MDKINLPTELTITAEHIAEADRLRPASYSRVDSTYNICRYCPTALALAEATGLDVHVGIDKVVVRDKEGKSIAWGSISSPLSDAIYCWTYGEKFTPMTATIKW